MQDLYVASIHLEDKLDEGSYLYHIRCIRELENRPLVFDSPVSFFIGENGSGKSTLLEAIAISAGFNPEGGSRNFGFSSNDTHSDLYKHLVITRRKHFRDGFFLRAESFYNFATNLDELDKGAGQRKLIDSYGGRSLHCQSHGESFLALVKNRFSANGLYLLDEPEAALSPSRQMQLLVRIHDLSSQGCQFIIATHSLILMSYPGASVYEFSESGIRKIDYKESEHYRIHRDFIDRPEQMYHYLFDK